MEEDEEEECDVDEPGFVTMRAWEGDLDKEFPAETPEGQVSHPLILFLIIHPLTHHSHILTDIFTHPLTHTLHAFSLT